MNVTKAVKTATRRLEQAVKVLFFNPLKSFTVSSNARQLYYPPGIKALRASSINNKYRKQTMTHPVTRFLATCLLGPLSTIALAADITPGEPLPDLTITEKGECVLRGEETAFVPWSTGDLNNKIQVVEYVAARAGIDKVHEDFYAALETEFDPETIGVTKLINSDDAMWGTSGLVVGEVKKNKQQKPEHRLVVDAEGLGLEQWGLEEKTANLIVLDAEGRVLLFEDEAMSEQAIADAVGRMRQAVAQ